VKTKKHRTYAWWLIGVVALCGSGAWADARALTDWLRSQMWASGVVDDLALSALRELRDPRLRPLFAAQATGDNVGRRVIGMLALAEVESPARLDPLMLKNAASEPERLEVIRQGVEHGLLRVEDERALLDSASSGSGVEAWLALRAVGRADPADVGRAQRLATDPSPAVSGAGALLLAAAGDADKAKPILTNLLKDRSDQGRARAADLLRAAARHNIRAAAFFADEALKASADDHALAAEAVGALMALEPDRGAKEWTKRYDAAKSDLAGKIRLGLIALERARPKDDAVHKKLLAEKGSTLLRAMGEVVKTRGAPAHGGALSALARERHTPSMAWMVYAAEREDGPAWLDALETTSTLDARENRLPPSLLELSVRAAALLFERSPDRARRTLDRALSANDPRPVAAMLLGALRASSGSVGLAQRSEGWPDSETEALATILRARDASTPDPALAERLERIAFGRGGVSRGRRVQAAWLGLVHLGRERAALTDLLSR